MLTRRSFLKRGMALLAATATSTLLTLSMPAIQGESIQLMTLNQADALAISAMKTRERIAAQIFNDAFNHDAYIKLCA